MCSNARILSHTKNGFFLQCKSCKCYQVSFGNFYLELTQKELEHFQKFLAQLDVDHWDDVYCSCAVKRKIPIPTLQSNLQIMLSRSELEELKFLLSDTKKNIPELISAEKVDYNVLFN